MKYLFVITSVLLSRLIACDNFGGSLTNTADDSAKADIKMLSRDVTITSANSYSDLFLDSIALENYIAKQKVSDSAAIALRNFYNVRNYQFAWFNSEGFTEEGRGFWSLYDYYNDSNDSLKNNKALVKKMDTLTEIDTLQVTSSDSSFIHTELSLTTEFIKNKSWLQNQVGFNDPYLVVPTRKMDAMDLADSILNKGDSAENQYDSLNRSDSQTYHAQNPYNLLKQQLRKYYEIAEKGSQPLISRDIKKFSKGKSYTAVSAIKKRLLLTGDLTGNDTSVVYNDSLASAIISYKVRHGFDSSEILTDSLINDLNTPALQRIEQILINMNRMKWVPDISSNKVIEVNIPEFMLKIFDAGSKALEMKVVVGKEGANTTMFSGNLDQIVFSPYWNIPASIVEEEIIPAMKTDPNYLQKHHMEIVKQNDSLPVIRQTPGPDNAMGKVKFLFPNSYDIFFHDTPAKDLFAQDKRAYSHGCIRVEDAKKLAEYLMKDDKNWTSEKIEQAMNSGKEQFVSVKNPVPVIITYFTAWVDENGQLNFRDDVYKHDAKTREKMFGRATLLSPENNKVDSMHKDSIRKREII
jgi:L,D-transpeptidase YcbB